MLQAQLPINNYFLSVYKHPEELGSENILYERVENIVDIIKSRLNSKGIEYTCASLRDDMWELRFDILEQQENLDEILSKIHEVVISEIIKLQYNKNILAKANSDALELYAKVLSHFTHHAESEQMPSLKDFASNRQIFNSLKLVHAETWTKDVDLMLKYIQNSLDLECGLIINSLIFSNELEIDIKNKEPLAEKLKDSAINVAFYTALLGIWTPDNDDETPYVRNVKILLADYELKNENAPAYTIDEFKKQFIN